MQNDLERYKLNTLIAFMIIAYTSMRFYLNAQYLNVTFQKMVAFDVIKPYAYRVLFPIIAHYVSPLIGVYSFFYCIELLGVIALFYCTSQLGKLYFDEKLSLLFSLLLLVLLSLTYIINYRYAIGGKSTFFFPYDTWALVFTVLGLLLCLKQRFLWLYGLIIVATLNRESSLLIICMLPALYAGKKVRWIRPFLISFLLYVIVRGVVSYALRFHDGQLAELYNLNSGYAHLTDNMYFLLQKNYFLWLMAEMSYMPLLWFAFSNYIPKALLRLRFIALLYVLSLFVIGNIIEGRIWGEAVVLLYLPVMLGLKNWLIDHPITLTTDLRGLALIEHYFAITLLFIAFVSGVIFFKITSG